MSDSVVSVRKLQSRLTIPLGSVPHYISSCFYTGLYMLRLESFDTLRFISFEI